MNPEIFLAQITRTYTAIIPRSPPARAHGSRRTIRRASICIALPSGGSQRGHDAKSLDAIRESGDVDAQPEQLKRIEGAKKIKPEKIELHVDTQSAIFSGSGKVPYITSLDACTCRDYTLRKLPCKHIYRLRMELDAARENAEK